MNFRRMFGSNVGENVPKIKILGFSAGKAVGGSHLTVGKQGYVRISAHLAEMIGLEGSQDYVVFGQFGSELLIARKPENEFGHVLLEKQGTKKISWIGRNTDVTKELGQVEFTLADEETVADEENHTIWAKLKKIE